MKSILIILATSMCFALQAFGNVMVNDYVLSSGSDTLMVIKSNSTTANKVSIADDNGDHFGFIRGGSSGTFGLQDLNSKWIIRSDLNTDTRFYQGDDVRMTILQNGKVGIGTETPTDLLELKDGNLTIRGDGPPAILTLEVTNPTETYYEPIIKLVGEQSSTGDINEWRILVDQSNESILTFRAHPDGGTPTVALEMTQEGEVLISNVPAQGDIDMGIFGNP